MLAYVFLALLLAGLGALAAHYHAAIRSEGTETVLARRIGLAQLAAATLSERLERMRDVAVSLATRVRFAELVAAEKWDAAVAILREVPSELPYVERLFLTDTQGTLMAGVPPLPGAAGRSFAERDWYRKASRETAPYVSAVYRSAAQRNVIAVASAVRERSSGRLAGVLVLELSLEALFDWARSIELVPGVSMVLVDPQGQAAYGSGARGAAIDLARNFGAEQLRKGRSGAQVAAAGGTGEERLYAFVPAQHGWGVLIEQPARGAFAARDSQLALLKIAYALAAFFLAGATWLGVRAARVRRDELRRARQSLATHEERLRILHEIDGAIVAQQSPEAIVAAVMRPLRELLNVPRVIVNKFDLAAGEVEWIAAAGRRRMHVGPGVRYSIRLMGEVEALRRGEPQRVDVHALPPGPEREALLASDVRAYMVVPMIAAGELIGGLSFGAQASHFPPAQVNIAQEVATQLAIAISQARLHEKVKQHAGELELRVAERTAALESANQELESFSYSVSHDLRAPLRAVDGFARIVEEDYGERLDAEGRRLLAVVRSSSRQMGELIDDLLDFSRLGRLALDKRQVDMRALVHEVMGELGVEPGPGPLPSARVDRVLMKQVWSNLLGNARKYSGKRADPRIEVGGREEAAENIYWVRDNGVGFDMRYVEKLFRVFQRLHGADEFAGTGVGLAIVQRVVARHGGRVWAEGRLGEGACFYFSLPRHADA